MKKIVFLTGTRADFGKLKSLIKITQESPEYEIHIFVTGMHMNSLYGYTLNEIIKSGFKNIYTFINHNTIDFMDRTLAKTIDGFSHYIAELKPNMIIVHGDRVEAMAGALVGSLNNILVTHIEGGEISGTIDELIRHSISKLAHIHLVSSDIAKNRLIQLGELENSIFIIGSPDKDIMLSKNLPKLEDVKKYYNIEFKTYSIAMFHPITTEYNSIRVYIKEFIDALLQSKLNYILIYPNNDLGSLEILQSYKMLQNNPKIKIFPSLRFEYFLELLKNATFIIGNSSAGICEAPFYRVPTIDIGTRQNNRLNLSSIIHTSHDKKDISLAINKVLNNTIKYTPVPTSIQGGHSDILFLELLKSDSLWKTNHQKQFQELV